MARTKAKERVATTADRAPRRSTRPDMVTAEQIADRAYHLYLARGCEQGDAIGDWLQAERELNSRSR